MIYAVCTYWPVFFSLYKLSATYLDYSLEFSLSSQILFRRSSWSFTAPLRSSIHISFWMSSVGRVPVYKKRRIFLKAADEMSGMWNSMSSPSLNPASNISLNAAFLAQSTMPWQRKVSSSQWMTTSVNLESTKRFQKSSPTCLIPELLCIFEMQSFLFSPLIT